MRQFFLVASVLTLLLAGCASEPPRIAAPVSEPAGALSQPSALPEERVEDSGVVIRAYEPPEMVAVVPTHGQAVRSLVGQAEKQEAAGNLPAAISSIERALRIEPRNAHLWNKLAHLRFTQGQNGLAEELASKSNSLAGADVKIKRDNWNLIARARRALGDATGAGVAERKARLLY